MQPDETFSTTEGLLQQRKFQTLAEEIVKLRLNFLPQSKRVQVKHRRNVVRQMTVRRRVVYPARCRNREYKFYIKNVISKS